MINYNVLNEYIETLKAAGVTPAKLVKLINAIEITNDTNMTIGTNLNVDGQITQNGGTPIELYLLSFNVSDTYVSILTSVKTGFNGKLMNTDSSDYTVITLTDEEKAILLKALKSSVKYFINVNSDAQTRNALKDDRQIFFNDINNEYAFSITWHNDIIAISDNAYDDTIAIIEERII